MGLVLAEGRHLARHRRRRPCRVPLVDAKSMRKGHGQFSTILVDGDRGRVMAVLGGRSADVLEGFLAAGVNLGSAITSVSVVVTDMAECYRKAESRSRRFMSRKRLADTLGSWGRPRGVRWASPRPRASTAR